MWLTNIFSIWWLFFNSLSNQFHKAKVLNFDVPSLSSQHLRSHIFSARCSSRCPIIYILHLSLQSILSSFLYKAWGTCHGSLFWHMEIQHSKNICCKESVSQCIAFATLWKTNWHFWVDGWVYFWLLHSAPLICLSFYENHISLILSYYSGQFEPSDVGFLFRSCLGYFNIFAFPYNF